jgi:hypothetical protein
MDPKTPKPQNPKTPLVRNIFIIKTQYYLFLIQMDKKEEKENTN